MKRSKSQCRSCGNFSTCNFVAFVPVQMVTCPDYKKAKIDNGADVKMVGAKKPKVAKANINRRTCNVH